MGQLLDLRLLIESPLTWAWLYFKLMMCFSFILGLLYSVVVNKICLKHELKKRNDTLLNLTIIIFILDIIIIFIGSIIWNSIYPNYGNFVYITCIVFYIMIISNPVALLCVILGIKYNKGNVKTANLVVFVNLVFIILGTLYTLALSAAWI